MLDVMVGLRTLSLTRSSLGGAERVSCGGRRHEVGAIASFQIITEIAAPIEVCFDLARDIDVHIRSLADTEERAVAGRTSGLIGHGESVTWEARHLGVRQRLTAEVTAFDRPAYFRDVMTRGAFRSFAHDHRFEARDGLTVMTDEVEFRSPLGPLGWLVDSLFMTGYLRRLLESRCLAIKRESESLTRRPAELGVADAHGATAEPNVQLRQ